MLFAKDVHDQFLPIGKHGSVWPVIKNKFRVPAKVRYINISLHYSSTYEIEIKSSRVLRYMLSLMGNHDQLTSTTTQLSLLLIGKIFVYKHCFCYLNVQNVKQKNSVFHQPIVLWLAY